MEGKSISATFLGLPPELRLHIYNIVVRMDVDQKAIQPWMAEHLTRPEDAVDTDPLSKRLVWLNLLRTCKLVHKELDSMISNIGYLSRELNHTHEIDIVMGWARENEKDYHRRRRHVTRQTIPCKLPHAKAVVLNLTLPDDCDKVREEMDIVRWIWHGVWVTLAGSGPLMGHRGLADPSAMWLRKATINAYGLAVPVASTNFDKCLRYAFGDVWPTEEVHLYLHATQPNGSPVVSELHLNDLYDEKLRT